MELEKCNESAWPTRIRETERQKKSEKKDANFGAADGSVSKVKTDKNQAKKDTAEKDQEEADDAG